MRTTKKTVTVCPYCSVGCGMIVNSLDNKILSIEGDPENPVNEGALCLLGASVQQLVENPERVLKPKYRAPNTAVWQDVEWDWAIDAIAGRVRATREATFKAGVNRTDAIASIGSCSLSNEECYLIQRLMRSWGIVYLDDKTRT